MATSPYTFDLSGSPLATLLYSQIFNENDSIVNHKGPINVFYLTIVQPIDRCSECVGARAGSGSNYSQNTYLPPTEELLHGFFCARITGNSWIAMSYFLDTGNITEAVVILSYLFDVNMILPSTSAILNEAVAVIAVTF